MKSFVKILFMIFPSWVCSFAFSQVTFEKYYGGIDYDEANAAVQTNDGGFIVVGYTKSFGAGSSDFYVVRTNPDGDTIWTRTYGGTGYDAAHDITKADETHYVIGGYTSSFGASDGDIYLIKINDDGDTLWTKMIGTGSNDHLEKIRNTSDGGFVICGYIGDWDQKYWIIKTDDKGDTLWTKSYDYGEAQSIIQTQDGGYALIVYPYATSYSRHDFQLVKTDQYGDTLWTKFLGGSAEDQIEIGFAIAQATDGGYLLAGRVDGYGAGGSDFLIIKTNANGDMLWFKTFGGASDERAFALTNTSDGGYLIGGYTSTFGGGYFDFYLVRIDENGDSLWTRTYGGPWQEMAYDVKETSDGGYLVAGYTQTYGAGLFDFYLVRLNQDGLISGIDDPENSFGENVKSFQNYPNPFIASTVISWQSLSAGWQTLKVYDVLGNEIAKLMDEYKQAGSYTVTFNAIDLAAGVYCCKLTSGDESSTIKMMIRE